MRDQADAGGGEARAVRAGAIDRGGEFLREIAAHGRDVDADLFEHLALHQAARPAAGIGIAFLFAVPAVVLEAGIAARLALDGFEFGADTVAQAFEPGAGGLGLLGPVGHGKSLAIPTSLRQ